MNDTGLEAPFAGTLLGAESSDAIVALVRRGRIPIDLAADFYASACGLQIASLLSDLVSPGSCRRPRLASSAVELALRSAPAQGAGSEEEQSRRSHST